MWTSEVYYTGDPPVGIKIDALSKFIHNTHSISIYHCDCSYAYLNLVFGYRSFVQAESRFREELGDVNITLASRTFITGKDPIGVEDVFVS